MQDVKKNNSRIGFTIVELLIVIVVIGILAAITVVAYNGVQDRARQAKYNSDLAVLQKAIEAARVMNNSNLFTITNAYTEEYCLNKATGTNLATLAKTDLCWSKYIESLDDISTMSGINVRNIVDPWGRPYYLNENEGEGSWATCNQDVIGVYSYPFVTYTIQPASLKNIPLYTTAC